MASGRWTRMDSVALRSMKVFADIGTAVLIVFVLYAARDILIPMTLSTLLAFLLSPVVNWFQKKGLSNITAVMVTASGLFIILVFGLIMLGSSLAEFAKDYPKYKGEIAKKADTVSSTVTGLGDRLDEFLASSFQKDSKEKGEPSSDGEPETRNEANEKSDTETSKSSDVPNGNGRGEHAFHWQNYLGSVGTVFGPIGTSGLVAVFALFMLINRDDLRDRFVAVISRGNYVVTTEAIAEASERISKYISAQFLLNSAYGILFGIGLWIIGLVASPTGSFPNLMFFVVLAGVVRFLPYVGPLIGAGVPLLISIAVFPGYTVFLAVLALIVSMELVSNNIVEPWLYGSRTGVSAIGVITAAVFWGWLWGGVGLLLATPLTVCLVVLGRYVPKMRYFATLLSDEEQVAPSLRSYQRLLANDEHKLRESLIEQAKKKENLEFLDEIIVPLGKRILRQPPKERPTPRELTERLRAVLEQESMRSYFIPELEVEEPVEEPAVEALPANGEAVEVAKPSVEGVVSTETASIAENAPPAAPKKVHVVAVGSQVPIEGLLLSVFAAMLPEMEWSTIESGELLDSATREIVELKPDTVLILSMPPGGVRQTQFWCKALRRDGFDGDILVVRPAKMRRYYDLFVLLRKSGANSLATSFGQAARRLQLLQRTLPS